MTTTPSDRIDRIKKFHWNIWVLGTEDEFKNLPTATNAIFHGPNVEIVAEDIMASEVPIDFGIKSGWKAIMKPLFPKSIPGDLLALVRLSNQFDMRDKAPKLKRLVTQSPARPRLLALLTARLEKPCQSRVSSSFSKVA